MKTYINSAVDTNFAVSSVPDGWINAVSCGASGSDFQTTGIIRTGSNEIVVQDAGDFRAGQEVTVYGCNTHYYGMVYNDREPFFARNQSVLSGEIELRGLGVGKTWQTFIVHFNSTEPATFNWMVVDPAHQKLSYKYPYLHNVWRWQGEGLPISASWIPLADGVEMRFKKRDWLASQSISFHARNRLIARIAEICGRTLLLTEKANQDSEAAVIRHHDQDAMQNALDKAVEQHKGLFIPAGRYRLSTGLRIRNASVRIEGAHRDHTLLDISDEHTSVFWISGGRDISIRNLGMSGHTGFRELPSNTNFSTAAGFPFWPTANQQMEVKGCAAANFVGTEHLLFEDLKVSRMASEAFYSHGADRYGMPPYIQAPHEGQPELLRQYTKSCVFHRCRVSDCGFNAFNNNDHAENTSILHCHVERTFNFCENASRFTRIIGNYVKDSHATSVHGGKANEPHRVGPTQAIIADNVFEGGAYIGTLQVGNNATQVIISNNTFIGYSAESAVSLLGGRRVIITGNHIDLTRIDDNPDNERCGVSVEASNVTIADNHIYCRGEICGRVTGINIAEDAVNVHIHGNIIERCGVGLSTGRRVFVGDRRQGQYEFRHTEALVAGVDKPDSIRLQGLPQRCDDPAPYAGWFLYGQEGVSAGISAEIKEYDPATGTALLAKDSAFKSGDRLFIAPPTANWQIHHNTFSGCFESMIIGSICRTGMVFCDNIVSATA